MYKNNIYITDIDEYDKKLVECGQNLLDEYEDHNILSIGSSPVYIANAAEFLAQKTNKNMKITYVPFSGRFSRSKTISQNGIKYTKCNQITNFNENNVINYCKYLTSIGVTPNSIMANFRSSRKPTILLDFIQSGEGTLSLIHILEQFAKWTNVKWDPNAIKIVNIDFGVGVNSSRQCEENLESFYGNRYKLTPFYVTEDLHGIVATNQRSIPPFSQDKWISSDYRHSMQEYLQNWSLKNEKYDNNRPTSPKTYEGPDKIVRSIRNVVESFSRI